MTSSFPEQRYNPQALSGGFNPIEQVDLTPAIQAEQERQMAPERERLAEIAANDKVRIQNAGQYGRDMQILSQFSNTLADQMLEYQKKENEKAMQRGMMNAYTEGVPEDVQKDFDEKEAMLDATKVAAEKDAADAEANGATVFTGEKIRKMSGWEKYGYVKGRMQIHAQGFPLFIAQNSDRQFNVGGETFTLNSAKTPEQQAAALSGLLSEYVDPYKEYNTAMSSKYLLKPLEGIMKQQMVLFAQQRGKEIKLERKAERANGLVSGFKELDPEANVAEWLEAEVKKHPLGHRAGRLEYYEVLKTAIDNEIISLEDAERFERDLTSFGGRKRETWVDKFPNDFGGLSRLIEDKRIELNTRENNLERVEVDEFLDSLETEIQGGATEAQKRELIKRWKSHPIFGSRPVPERLANIYTKEQGVIDAEIEYMESIADANGGVIAPQYIVGKDPKAIAAVADKVGAGAAVAAVTEKQADVIDEYLQGASSELGLFTTGTTSFKDREAAIRAMNVEKKFNELLGINIVRYGPEEGLKQTIIEMNSIVDKVKATGGAYDPFVEVKGADESAYWMRQKAQNFVSGKNLGVVASETRILGIQDADLEKAKVFMQTGEGELPYIFTYLAGRDPRISAIELAGRQLEVTGFKGYKLPKREVEVTNSDNASVREKLRFKNTPSRTYRASIEDPELVRVLDLIASKESEAHGGYNAYNEGGYSADRPYGSADSSDGKMFGKPITQMTIGEVMALQAKPKGVPGIHAAGRYQFIGVTLKDVVREMGITKDMVFSPQLQDAMALHRLRWRLNQNNSTTGLINEWTGLKRLSKAQQKQLLEDAQDVFDDPYNSPELLLKGL